MALKAGRVGVKPSEVTKGGKVKGGPQYTLPVATATTLGGVKPVTKTEAMTQEVGVDSEGRLYVEPSEGGATILSGTDPPTTSVGTDGAIYLQTEGLSEVSGGYADPAYVVTSTSQRLSTHSTTFYKTVEGAALAVEGIVGGWRCPVLISDNADYAKFTENTTPTNVTVDGKTWYICGGVMADRSADDPTIPALELESWNNADTIRAILEAAGYTDTQCYTIKTPYLKVSGTWQLLIGSNIDDVVTGGEQS